MSVFTDISIALDTRLGTMSGLPDVAWPNRTYTPVIGTTYLRPTLLPADSIAATVGTSGTDENIGVYQVSVFTEAGNGKSAGMVMSDLIASHLKRDTELTYNSRTVRIKNVSQSPASTSGGWFQIPVNIEYYAFTAKR